jgi:hypothetical protein
MKKNIRLIALGLSASLLLNCSTPPYSCPVGFFSADYCLKNHAESSVATFCIPDFFDDKRFVVNTFILGTLSISYIPGSKENVYLNITFLHLQDSSLFKSKRIALEGTRELQSMKDASAWDEKDLHIVFLSTERFFAKGWYQIGHYLVLFEFADKRRRFDQDKMEIAKTIIRSTRIKEYEE